MEILKAQQYSYPRLRFADQIQDGLLTLITCVDAAQGIQIYCYLTHPMATGRSVNLYLGKGFLCNIGQAFPKRE